MGPIKSAPNKNKFVHVGQTHGRDFGSPNAQSKGDTSKTVQVPNK